MIKRLCVDKCDGCARSIAGRCIAFDAPVAMWYSGICWGFETDRLKVAMALYDCVKYILAKKFDAIAYADAETLLDEYLTENGISHVDLVRMKNALVQEMTKVVESASRNDVEGNGNA